MSAERHMGNSLAVKHTNFDINLLILELEKNLQALLSPYRNREANAQRSVVACLRTDC